MLKKIGYHISLFITLLFLVTAKNLLAQQVTGKEAVEIDTSGNLAYPFDDQGEFDYPDEVDQNPLYLRDPMNFDRKVEYDPESQSYIIYERIGDMYYRMPKSMSLKEYVKYDFDRSIKDYWRSRKETEAIEVQEQGRLIPQLRIESEAFNNIFGSEVIDIRPQGYVEVQFGLESSYMDDRTLPERLRRVTTFDFENQININVRGKIGDKVDMDFKYNTEATFDFENKMNLEYAGKEDEILRRIEAGNVSLPLNGSLIQGGTNLFGVKTEMQFGKLNVTTILTQHKGESQVIETEGGAQKTRFEIKASDYDENRHFFVSKFFRDQYNEALSTLPIIRSSAVVNKIEVWITNKNQDFNSSRNIVAFVDLGEIDENITNSVPQFAGNGYASPDNDANGLYRALINNYPGVRNSAEVKSALSPLEANNFTASRDWEKIDQARKLKESEYTFNEELGYISLNSPLNNDEVLAVAYEYTVGGEVHRVGEFTSSSVPSEEALILKLIKGINLSPQMPTWDLMMKNVYSLGAYDLAPKEFDFQVLYRNDSTNTYINYLPEGELRDTILLRLMNLDNLNSQRDYAPNGDGVFDFIPGVTVNRNNGRVIFPVLEPFGNNISDNISDPKLKDKYAHNSIYDETKTKAEQDFDHDKFALVGSYQGSSGSEISLNSFNLAPGSVKVTAGGRDLQEDIDYTVDYAIGRVKIINEGLIEAGTPIQVSTESQELITTQRKTLLGSYANYGFSDKFNMGGTFMFMNERPITNKVEMGEEPVTNLMLGLDFQYNDRSRFLTDVVNLLPFYESDVESSISIEGEVAKLISGNSKSTGNQIYIDDFEGVETTYSFTNAYGWSLASTPQKQLNLFPEAELNNDILYGVNRARLSWYYVDRTVFNEPGSSVMPSHIKADPDLRSNHYTRTVMVNEIYPGKEIPFGMPNYLNVLDLAFYPKEKGPYNFDAAPSDYSAGVDEKNHLKSPESRWGGVMRDIKTPNFETANVEFIEFWMLDPFIYDEGTHEGGDLYFNLGNVSEDILKDSRKAFESGLPVGSTIENVDTTAWGRVSTKTQLAVGFDNNAGSRQYQDVGLDGLSDLDEQSFYEDYLASLENILTPNAFQKVLADPSNDNFRYYRGSELDALEMSVLQRYKMYNNTDGNSPTQEMSTESYTMVGKNEPDIEDINGDNTLNEAESYYQYKVSIRPEDLQVGQNFIVDRIDYTIKLPNGEEETVQWYQFKIPITNEGAYDRVGEIYDFKSIRFMRMFLTNFQDSVMLRFGTLGLVRSDWRKEEYPLVEKGSNESVNAEFDVTSINIEENNSRRPINYILPPGIERENDPSNPTPIEMNEQAMLLKVKDLEAGDARAVYKNVGTDLRQYKRLQMEVHAEAIDEYELNDYEMSAFIRLGSDRDNYYEYEIPLKLTPEPVSLYNNGSEADRRIVWPDENRLYLELQKLPDLKMARDAEVRRAGSKLNRSGLYEVFDEDSPEGKNIMRVKGNPSLGEVDVVHIGIRNPKRNNQEPKSVEVWANELRVSDLESKGGWASTGRMSLRLADLGNVSLAGRTQSVGWGSINQMASQRSLDNKYQYDVALSAEVGKLLPEKIGLRAPVFYSVTKSVANPEYNPLSTDVKIKDALGVIESPEERDSLLASSQDVMIRRSFNLNNISVEPKRKKASRKALPTDIENFSVSYAKNEQLTHNIDIENYLQRLEKGTFNYNYTVRSQPITPFKNVGFLKPKPFALIRDFNFTLLPELISYRTDLSRSYNERTARDNSGLNIEMPTTVQKDFLWNRYFDLRYNLTQALKVDFTNRSTSRIDELDGVINKELYPDQYALMMEEIRNNLLAFGRQVDYQHTLTVNYRLPLNKLPLLDWTTASVNYQGSYDWLAGPVLPTNENGQDIQVGNTIGNNMNIRANGTLNFLTLYNKVPYLKEVNDRFRSYGRSSQRGRSSQNQRNAPQQDDKPKKTREVDYTDKKVDFRADVPKSVFHRLGTKDVQVVLVNERGDTIPGETTIVDENRINFKTETNVRGGTVYVTGTRQIDELFFEKALALSTRFLMGVRNVRLTYSKTGASEIPGFVPEPYLFGTRNYSPENSSQSLLAPTLPFLAGWQDSDFVLNAADNGWLAQNNAVQRKYIQRNSESYSANVEFEPIANIRIDFSGVHREARDITSFISYNEQNGIYEFLNEKESGNFEMSVMTLKTMFRDNLRDTTNYSGVFDDFQNRNLQIIANRLNEQRGWNPNTGYSRKEGETVQGVSLNSSDVIIPAFLSAYTGIDPMKVPLTARPGLSWVRPNWRINYNGNPQQIDWLKDVVHSLNFSHSYRASYTIGRFETNLGYQPDENGLSWTRDELDGSTFVSELDIASVSIMESFSPLINVDIGFVNDLSARFEIRKSRNLNFDFTANQMNEMSKNEYSIGFGYRFSGLDMIVRTRNTRDEITNDINLRFDIKGSDYKNVLRKLDPVNNVAPELNGGTRVLTLDFQADYIASDKLTVKLYYSYNMNDPHTTINGFKRTNTKFGLSFNFSIM